MKAKKQILSKFFRKYCKDNAPKFERGKEVLCVGMETYKLYKKYMEDESIRTTNRR